MSRALGRLDADHLTMAYSFSNNNTPANGSLAMWLLISTLQTAGWTNVKDSDGTTYSAAGTQVTSGASGAGGLGNASAWKILQHPTVGLQICVQHSTVAGTHPNWRIQISRAARFVTGAPSATITASASDAQLILGGGTDAAPTMSAFFAADGGYRFNVAAGGSDTLYPFVCWGFPTGNASGTFSAMWALDMMVVGSFPAADTVPWIMHFVASATASSAFYAGFATAATKGYLLLSSVLTWVDIAGMTYGAYYPATSGGLGVGVNSFNNKDNGVPMPYGRVCSVATPTGHKGFGTMFRWAGTGRATMDALDFTGTRDRVWIGGNLLPWGGSIPLI